MKFKYSLLFVLAAFIAAPVYGQKFLQKPYKEWSQDDAIKILKDSPWAIEYQSERLLDLAAKQQQQREQADTRLSGTDRGNQNRPSVPMPVRARLHSAGPIRQAMVRLQQIQAKYDKMSAEDQKKFDDSTAKFLECAICKDYYVITITKWKDTSTSGISDGIFQSFKLADLKGKVWLVNDKDEKLELTEFTAPKSNTDSAVLFFKRADDKGAPFFTPSDKQVRLMFATELRSNTSGYSDLIPRSFEFKVSKMLTPEGKLEF